MNAEEMIRTWAKQAQSSEILTMTETEAVIFAKKNRFVIYDLKAPTTGEIIGWRLYKTKGEARIPDKLYYVVRKYDIMKES